MLSRNGCDYASTKSVSQLKLVGCLRGSGRLANSGEKVD